MKRRAAVKSSTCRGRRATARRKPAAPRADFQAGGLTPVGQARPSGAPFHDASRGRRTDGFFAPEIGPAAAVITNLQILRARSRALHRMNPWARNARRTFTANVVGSFGLKPRFRYEPETWGRVARAAWDEWAERADVTGLGDYYAGVQAIVANEVFEAGECFVQRMTVLDDDELPVPLQLKVLASEHCPLYYSRPLPDGGWIQAGIEFDSLGRRRAYHFYQHHPGEFVTSLNLDLFKLVRVPAEDVIHVFVPERAEMIRGVPSMACSLLRLWGLDEFDDAELDKNRMAASITGTIELLDPEKADKKIGQLHAAALSERGGGPFTTLEPGTLSVLGPGEKLSPFPPAEQGRNYEPFHAHNLRACAADSSLTFEMFTGDLSKTTFVSLRYGDLNFRKRCELTRAYVNLQLNRRVLAWWLDLAVMMEEGVAVEGYETDPAVRRAARRVSWIPPAWPYVQPDREVGAETEMCRSGFTTSDRIVEERTGEDGAEIALELAAIQERNKKLGLKLDSDPSAVSKPATGVTATREETQAAASDESGGGAASDSSTSKSAGTGTNG